MGEDNKSGQPETGYQVMRRREKSHANCDLAINPCHFKGFFSPARIITRECRGCFQQNVTVLPRKLVVGWKLIFRFLGLLEDRFPFLSKCLPRCRAKALSGKPHDEFGPPSRNRHGT